MKIVTYKNTFAVCKLGKRPRYSKLRGVCFMANSENEMSIIADSKKLPLDIVAKDDGWRCMKIDANLDFSLVGILSEISTAFTDNNIPMLSVSTFDTDYFFVKNENLEKALDILKSLDYDTGN